MKNLIYTILLALISLFNTSAVFADGSNYNPYYHPPVDTGLITDPIYFVGLVLVISGIVLLSNAKSLKSKLNLD